MNKKTTGAALCSSIKVLFYFEITLLYRLNLSNKTIVLCAEYC